jgi:hypothetical protein
MGSQILKPGKGTKDVDRVGLRAQLRLRNRFTQRPEAG